jgi:hypothetical protein
MRFDPAIETIRSLVPVLVSGALLAGCLYSVDGDPEDEPDLGAGEVFLHSTTFTEEGIDPVTDAGDEESDAGVYIFGEYCTALFECICVGLDTGEFETCLETISEMSESECEQLLLDDYPECLP